MVTLELRLKSTNATSQELPVAELGVQLVQAADCGEPVAEGQAEVGDLAGYVVDEEHSRLGRGVGEGSCGHTSQVSGRWHRESFMGDGVGVPSSNLAFATGRSEAAKSVRGQYVQTVSGLGNASARIVLRTAR